MQAPTWSVTLLNSLHFGNGVFGLQIAPYTYIRAIDNLIPTRETSTKKTTEMEDKNSERLLRNPDQKPTDKLFKSILDRPLFGIMNKVEQTIVSAGLVLEWRYYNDGKAWLGKVTYKKKTIVWLSVWKEWIKAGFYFTERSRPGVLDLEFSDNIKSLFAVAKPIGKLIPLVVEIDDEERLKDFNIILDYKKDLS